MQFKIQLLVQDKKAIVLALVYFECIVTFHFLLFIEYNYFAHNEIQKTKLAVIELFQFP